MLAVLVDVGHHFVEPNSSGQTIALSVASSQLQDAGVAGFDLRAQIVTTKQGPVFQGVRFAGDLWNSFPHIESGGPLPADPTLATGQVAFTQGFEARADGTLVKLTIDTTGIAAGSYEFRLVGTKLGTSSFRRADGSSVSEIITNGTLQVRSIWQNPDNPSDINGDGRVSPVDVLLLLNELSKKGAYELPLPSPGEQPASHYDVNGDGYLSPLDPLEAINCLNGLSCNTTPKPILAKVTPNVTPPVPDTTGANGPPVAEDPPLEEPPFEGADGEIYPMCDYYELEKDEFPVPAECLGLGRLEAVPRSMSPTLSSSFAAEGVAKLKAGPAADAPSFLVSPLSPKSVDAVITDMSSRIFDGPSNDELTELGLALPLA